MRKRATRRRQRASRPLIRVVPTDAILLVAAEDRLVRHVQSLAKPPKRVRTRPHVRVAAARRT